MTGGRPSEAPHPILDTDPSERGRRRPPPGGSRRKPWPPRAEAPRKASRGLAVRPRPRHRSVSRHGCWSVHLLRPVPVPDRDLGPGAHPARRLPARRRRPSRLDGPAGRHARYRSTALLDPRQRTIDLHLEVARIPDPALGWAPAGLARRGRDRPARRDRLGPSWPRAPCSCGCPRGPWWPVGRLGPCAAAGR